MGSVYVEKYSANGIVIDSNQSLYSATRREGVGTTGSSIADTRYIIDPETQWPGWNSSVNTFDFVMSIDAGSGLLVMGDPFYDESSTDQGQIWITNYDGNNWKRITGIINQSTKFGTSVAIGSGKIAVGAPETTYGFANAGSVAIYDYQGTYERVIYPNSSYNVVDGRFGDRQALSIGDGVVAIGQSKLIDVADGEPAAGLTVHYNRLDTGAFVRVIQPLHWMNDQLDGMSFTPRNETKMGESVAYGHGRWFMGDSYADIIALKAGGICSWKVGSSTNLTSNDFGYLRTYVATEVGNNYKRADHFDGQTTADNYNQEAGAKIRVGSGCVATGIVGLSQFYGYGRRGGILVWDISSGKLVTEVKLPNDYTTSTSGAFGTYDAGSGLRGDFDIGCGYIVGASNADDDPNGTTVVGVWTINGELVEVFSLGPVDNTEHVVRQVKIADGYVFICGNITSPSTKGFVYRFTLPSNADVVTESILSPYINLP
jgi:hypothetical protein